MKAVIDDILGHGNEKSMLPGSARSRLGQATAAAGGLLFTEAEIDAFNELAAEAKQPLWNVETFKSVQV